MIILSYTFALILVILTCRFGRAGLARLAALRLRGGTLAVLACLVQVTSIITQQRRLELLLVSAALLTWFYWLNRRQAGMSLAMAGIALNLTVMVLNDGTMPINPETFARKSRLQVSAGTEPPQTKNIVLEDDEARLPWLGDRLQLPGSMARLAVWSIGDMVLIAGIIYMLWHTMKGRRPCPADTLEQNIATPSWNG